MAIVWNKSIKELTGVVVSDKMDKTIVVEVSVVRAHPLYRKRFTTKKKYYVHSETNTVKVGDVVIFREARPLSASKRWSLLKIIPSSLS